MRSAAAQNTTPDRFFPRSGVKSKVIIVQSQNTRPRAPRQATTTELTVTSGRDAIGRIVDRQGRCTAFAADGRELGQFAGRKAAYAAINAATTELR
jgi:hypothetical protein